MRKILLGTTALVAAGMFAGTALAANPIKITVGGYMEQWFGIVNDDVGTRPADFTSANRATQSFNSVDLDQQHDSEIWFTGKTKLDNGVEIGVTIELEANTSGDQIDESYATVEYAGWRFVIGSENGAAYLMHYAAPDVGIGFNSGDQVNWIQFGQAGAGTGNTGYFDGPLGTTFLRVGDNDSQKLMLFTPRWFGFQAGVSYAPEMSQENQNGAVANQRNNLLGGVANRPSYSDVIDIGLNYLNTFNGLQLGLSFGYHIANAPGSVVAAQSAFTRFGADNIESYSFGATLGWGNFLIGGSYADVSDGFCLAGGAGANLGACTTTTSGMGFDIGARYTFGPWAISAMYFHGEQEASTARAGAAGAIVGVPAAFQTTAGNNDDEQDTYAVSLAYTLGPGILWRTSLFHTDFQSELAGTTLDQSNEGWALVTGLRLNF